MTNTSEVRELICRDHGPYTAVKIQMPEALSHVIHWSSCPACEAELKAYKAKPAAEARELMIAKNLTEAGILERYQEKDFDNFRPQNEAQRTILNEIKFYCHMFSGIRRKGKCIALLGAPGLGKTHLGVSMLRDIVRQGWTGLYARQYDFLRDIKKAWSGSDKKRTAQETEIISKYANPDILVMDEVGVQFFTAAEEIMIFQVIEQRYGAKKPTCIISNLGKPPKGKPRDQNGKPLPGETKDIEDALGFRSYERIMEAGSLCLEFRGESYRRRDTEDEE